MENKMSKGKIAVIVTASLLIFSLLAFAISLPFILRAKGGLQNEIRYADENKYSVGNAKLENPEFSSVELSWIRGDVLIKLYDGQDLLIEEEFEESAKVTDDNRLRYGVFDNVLHIQPCKSRAYSLKTDKEDYMPLKKLVVSIPLSLATGINEIKVDSVSAEITMTKMDVDIINVSTVSGNLKTYGTICDDFKISGVSANLDLTDVQIKTLTADNVSGRMNITGECDSVSLDTKSGELVFVADKLPSNLSIDSVSGNTNLVIPENDGFEISFDTVSGHLTAEDFDFDHTGNVYSYKNADNADFTFDSVSGDLIIIKK